jgi:hypothetical protein
MKRQVQGWQIFYAPRDRICSSEFVSLLFIDYLSNGFNENLNDAPFKPSGKKVLVSFRLKPA